MSQMPLPSEMRRDLLPDATNTIGRTQTMTPAHQCPNCQRRLGLVRVEIAKVGNLLQCLKPFGCGAVLMVTKAGPSPADFEVRLATEAERLVHARLRFTSALPVACPPADYIPTAGLDGTYGDCVDPPLRVVACPLCGKYGPHRSGPDDRFHHVVLNDDGSWPEAEAK